MDALPDVFRIGAEAGNSPPRRCIDEPRVSGFRDLRTETRRFAVKFRFAKLGLLPFFLGVEERHPFGGMHAQRHGREQAS
jgi:hypothetical protein